MLENFPWDKLLMGLLDELGSAQQVEPQFPYSEQFQASLETLWKVKFQLSLVSAICHVQTKVSRSLSIQETRSAVTTTYTDQVL